MRRAFIGLSSPTAYFYDHENKFFREKWRWNPILESPQGLITLFDELWFLTRSLCPVNLRKTNYVKFLDEDSSYKTIIKENIELFYELGGDEFLTYNGYLNDFLDFSIDLNFDKYNEVITAVYGKKLNQNLPIDNHSHSTDICGYNISGNSQSKYLLALDNVILDNLEVRGLELITNRFNNKLIKRNSDSLKKIQVSQGVTINHIPVRQTPLGPVIDRIDSIRENNFLVDFRSKILNADYSNEVDGIVSDIENQFIKYRNEVLIQKLTNSSLLTSVSTSIQSFLINSIVPIDNLKSFGEATETRKHNWTGFLAKLD